MINFILLMNYFIYGANAESVTYCNDKSIYSDETCYNLSYLYNDDLYNDWSNDWSEDSYNDWKKFLYKDWNKDWYKDWNKDLYKDLKKDFEKNFKKDLKKDLKKVSYNIFLLFFVVSTSLTVSTLFVSYYLYKNMVNTFVEKYNANKEYYDYDSYFFECLDEYYDLDEFNDDLDDLGDHYLNLKYIKQTTPKGEVIMNYNHTNSSFDYYSKKSNTIEFQYLDVVSRIYAVKYNCKNLYIDNYDNNEMLNLKQDDTYDTTLKQEKSDKSIFYTRSTINNNVAKEYVSNKYKYKGTCEDFYEYCKNNDFMIIQNCLENVKVDNLNDVANATFFLNKINILDNDYLDTIDNDTIEVNNNITISFKTFKAMNN